MRTTFGLAELFGIFPERLQVNIWDWMIKERGAERGRALFPATRDSRVGPLSGTGSGPFELKTSQHLLIFLCPPQFIQRDTTEEKKNGGGGGGGGGERTTKLEWRKLFSFVITGSRVLM